MVHSVDIIIFYVQLKDLSAQSYLWKIKNNINLNVSKPNSMNYSLSIST